MAHRRKDPFRKTLQRIEETLRGESTARDDTDDTPIIYHYTDPKGLIGILSSGQLWATDIRYLNDSSELIHAATVHKQFLKELSAKYPDDSSQGKLAADAGNRSSWLHEALDTYVVCFSAIDDLVTQWNTYGSRGSGFSIGFDRKKLAEAIQPPPLEPATNWEEAQIRPEVRLTKVIYSESEQQREFGRVFHEFHDGAISAESSQQQIELCAKRIVDRTANSASAFKHECFKAEEEWRITVSILVGGANRHFRASSRTVIPYVKLPWLSTIKAKKPWPIVSITIGPTLNRDLSERSVRALLLQNDYHRVASNGIRVSKLPLALTD